MGPLATVDRPAAMGPSSVVVVGHGLIGGSIALRLAGDPERWRVQALDRGDELLPCGDADLVVLSAPIAQNLANLRALRGIVSARTLITDTGSTKASIVAAGRGMRFVGGHPVAGAAVAGRGAARADLFLGHRWILTPADALAPEDLSLLHSFIHALGAVPAVMDAAAHDRLFAYVSHLPQLTVCALLHAVGNGAGQEGLAAAGPGLRDSTRLATSPPAVWKDIVASNRENVSAALDALIGVLQALRDDETGEVLSEVFESAAACKTALDAPRPID